MICLKGKKVKLALMTLLLSVNMVDREKTNCIIVHHSATEQGNMEVFRKFHLSKGWDDVGYHYVITNGNGGPDGEIQAGRPVEKQGAHAKGRNHDSIGICLVGEDHFTEKQIESLLTLLVTLCNKYNLEYKTIQPHHENCPGPGLPLNKFIN